MKKTLILSFVTLVALGANAVAQDSAQVQITVKISDKTPSFRDQRLVVMLYHDNPLQGDRGDTAVDRLIDRKFFHQQGQETVFKITLGEKARLKPGVQYTVNLTVFDGASNRTHVGEMNGATGPFRVITNGNPRDVTLTVRPVP
jgi:hypothetical protein